MRIDELNSMLREMFKQFVDNGYKKHPICSVTLGDTFGPQFTNFLNGNDLGLGPLTRIIENLGYEIHLVPVSNDDQEAQTLIQDRANNFVREISSDLKDFLDNRQPKSGKVSQAFDNEIQELMSEIDSSNNQENE